MLRLLRQEVKTETECTWIRLVRSLFRPTQNLQIGIHSLYTLTSRYPNSALPKQLIKFTSSVLIKHITFACRLFQNPPLLKCIPTKCSPSCCSCFVFCTDDWYNARHLICRVALAAADLLQKVIYCVCIRKTFVFMYVLVWRKFPILYSVQCLCFQPVNCHCNISVLELVLY